VEPRSGRPTPTGRLLSRLGVHPRWGVAALRGVALGAPELAAVTAAMLGSERDVLRGGGPGRGTAARSADVALRLNALVSDGVAGWGRARVAVWLQAGGRKCAPLVEACGGVGGSVGLVGAA
jgi:hypothetical protein